ncbi:oxidase [Lithospermum erythrorhizon]|uniref:Laccase n=1 Tax=Lithospermum erythrorhizon TaxID=34254 RepID=A0AAV3RXU7_LITER
MGRYYCALLYGCSFLLLASSFTSAAVVEHTFEVKNLTIGRLCNQTTITAVNGSLPGPTLRVREGDTVIVHVLNKSPYEITIHWHGVHQFANSWADGPDYVTQCPIHTGNNYTYIFNVTRQEGTLWWHAHISYLRATVYGALIIRPRKARSYPFPKPHKEVPILLGEWWNANVEDVVSDANDAGAPPALSDAFTINGQPGDLYNCSSDGTYKLQVQQGKTYLLRMVNAAMQSILFFKVANHTMTVVSIDACYTNPYTTDTITIAPGQSMDVLLKADQPFGSYYMAASVYQGSDFVIFDETVTTGIIEYVGSTVSPPVMPDLPDFSDNETAHRFLTNLTALTSAPFWEPVPQPVDERMFITIGVNILPCDRPDPNQCQGPGTTIVAASMNNISFSPSTNLSILEAYYYNVDGIYTPDFPDQPPVIFDYTSPDNQFNAALLPTIKGARVKQLKYNSTVEIVFQNTALGTIENHPMHLHGFDFHVLAQGYGNYDPATDPQKFNLVNPQLRNTVAVPIGGWAVVRFRANNPGVWFMHCHLEVHVPWGLAGVFIVENGPTPETSLIPPPPNFPQC